jgi:protein ImuB
MSRYVSVFLPHLPIERLKRERAEKGEALLPDDRPFALVGSEERGLLLTTINAASLNEGLDEGFGLADARAICPHLLTAPAAPKKDEAALLTLARWASARYSPTLNRDGDDGLWLDVAGVPHLFGGEAALLADMSARLARAGFSAQLAVADTLGGAHALARYAPGSPIIVPHGKIEDALRSLPVESLRLEPEIALLLRRLGLKRIGQLYDLPRASLERRFHSKDVAEAVLLRLDQALGLREEPRIPIRAKPDFLARLSFPEPLISHDGVAGALTHLAIELCLTLAHAERGARRIALWVCRADGSSTVIETGLSAPSCKPEHLLRLLKDKIETLDVGFGVDLMALAALATDRLAPAQIALTEGEDKTESESLIDCLANRLGGRAVRRLVPKASHIPELAQAFRSAFAGPSFWPAQTSAKPSRPPLLFPRPEPVAVLAEIPEGPPARFTWRRVTRRVVKSEGPQRIAPEWWRALKSSPLRKEKGRTKPRDYYRIEDEDGHRYWIFRDGLYQESALGVPSWYLHGVFG